MPKRILVGASCRREPQVLEAHLKTLALQQLPDGTELHLCHVDDFTPEQRNAGRVLLESYNSEILSGDSDQMAVIDFDDKHPQTHVWQISAFERVAKNKQLIFDKAKAERYDYVWILDTDLLLEHTTLMSMYYAARPVVAGVYWTNWNAAGDQPAGPQVWLRHPYGLDGRGYQFQQFRNELAHRELVRVYGLGACMLLETKVLDYARYWPLLPELVAAGGMMAGEDRTFCVMCEHNHIEMWADAWPDIYHVYHTNDYANIDHYVEEFSNKADHRPLCPGYGDYVSLQIMPLEDPNIGPQAIRGRVARLGLLPEIEAAVLSMRPGERRLLSVTYPIHYPLGGTGVSGQPNSVLYPGTTKAIELFMIDHKPFGYAPVLRDEIKLVDGTPRDTFSYTKEQCAQFRAVRPTP